MDLHLSNTVRAANLKLSELKPFFKYMSVRSRTLAVNAHVMSIYRYGISQYLGANVDLRQRLVTSMMNIWRMTRGYIPYRNSNESVLFELKQEATLQVI